jgi:hypothetical protein
VDVEQHEPAERQIYRLRQGQFLSGLGEGDDLGLGGFDGRSRHLVPAGRVGVDRVHPTVAPDDAGQSHRHVPAASPDVGAPPPLAQAKSVEGGGEGPAVHVVAQLELDHGM